MSEKEEAKTEPPKGFKLEATVNPRAQLRRIVSAALILIKDQRSVFCDYREVRVVIETIK